jgi:hypothetical protein
MVKGEGPGSTEQCTLMAVWHGAALFDATRNWVSLISIHQAQLFAGVFNAVCHCFAQQGAEPPRLLMWLSLIGLRTLDNQLPCK